MEKILRFMAKVYILSTIIEVAGLVSGKVAFDAAWIKNVLDPFDFYWFFGAYALLMLTSPLLNLLMEHITLPLFKSYMLGFLGIICVYGFVIDGSLHLSSGYSYLMAVALYLLGNGIQKFQEDWTVLFYDRKYYLFIWLFATFCNSLLVKLFYKSGNGWRAWNFYAYNNPLVAIASVALLLFVIQSRMNFKRNWLLRQLPKSTIVAYMIHSTCWLTIFRQTCILWQIEHCGKVLAFCLLPVFAFGIYLLAALIDVVYERTFGKLLGNDSRAKRMETR